QYSIGVDIGGTDATVTTLIGIDDEFERVALIEGYYNKQGDIQASYDETQYIKEIVDAIQLWTKLHRLPFNTPVFVDDAAKLFKTGLTKELRRRGLSYPVNPNFKKDRILNRIRLNETLITNFRFFILNKGVFKPWIEAYENATWDKKHFDNGEYVRVDNNSFPVDC